MRARAEDRLGGVSNYFIGTDPRKWRTNIPQYGRLRYEGIYPGIDLVCYEKSGRLEYDFVVSAGANPDRIAFDY